MAAPVQGQGAPPWVNVCAGQRVGFLSMLFSAAVRYRVFAVLLEVGQLVDMDQQQLPEGCCEWSVLGVAVSLPVLVCSCIAVGVKVASQGLGWLPLNPLPLLLKVPPLLHYGGEAALCDSTLGLAGLRPC